MRLYLAATHLGNWGKSALRQLAPELANHRIGLLDSFWTLKADALQAALSDHWTDQLDRVMDSGAHTFQQPQKLITRTAIDQMVNAYLEYALQARSRFRWFAELDVEATYGMTWVDGIATRMLESGLPTCRVWHRNRGMEAWKAHCKASEYVGLSLIDKGDNFDHLIALCKYAYQQGCKVHAFAATDFRRLLKLPVYSVDSTSWMLLGRYGIVWNFDPTRALSTIKVKQLEKAITLDTGAAAIALGGRPGTYTQAEIELLPYTMKALSELCDFITEHWRKRGVVYDD